MNLSHQREVLVVRSPEEHPIVAMHHLKLVESETEPNDKRVKIHGMIDECKCLIKEYRIKSEES